MCINDYINFNCLIKTIQQKMKQHFSLYTIIDTKNAEHKHYKPIFYFIDF
jgi:hypothetical protein